MIDELKDNPTAFDFYAAVRLLERIAVRSDRPVCSDRLQPVESGLKRPAEAGRYERRPAKAGRREPVGGDADPREEIVRFTAEPAMTFSIGDISRVQVDAQPRDGRPPQPEMAVNFLGLVGPSGALPQHYTSLIQSRLRERDTAFRDFLDLFHHRSISLFYRAWKKYRLPFAYESSAHPGDFRKSPERDDEDGVDLATFCLFCLVGLGTNGLRGRRTFDDRVALYFGGTFSRQPRPALELERILAVQLAIPVRVQQFFGRWLTLGDSELSRLAGGRRQVERHNRLGVNVVIGQRIRDVQSSFRLILGPMTYRQFHRFTPLGNDLRPLCELARSFAGPEFEFDVQVMLAANQIPECRLDSTAGAGPLDACGPAHPSGAGPLDACGPAHPSGAGPRLGWNTWLRSREIDRETADAVFLLPDV